MDAYITYRYGELNNLTRPSELAQIHDWKGLFIAGVILCYLFCIYVYSVAFSMRSYVQYSSFISSVLFIPMVNLVVFIAAEISGLLFAYIGVPIFSTLLSTALYFTKNFILLRVLTVVVSFLPLACIVLTFLLSLSLIFLAGIGTHRDQIMAPAALVFFSILVTVHADWTHLQSTVKSLFGPYADASINYYIADWPRCPFFAEILHPLIPTLMAIYIFCSFIQFRHPIKYMGVRVTEAFQTQFPVLFWRARAEGSDIEPLNP
ncbi:unnamed protein product, partial [Mesorhabditis spiculigera]